MCPKIKGTAQLGLVLVLLLLAGVISSQAAFKLSLTGPRATALGGAGVALSGDAWSVNRNPGLLAVSPDAVGLTWSQLYGLPELSREVAVVTSATRGQPWGVQAGSFGSELYRESSFGVALGRSVTETVALGVEFRGDWLFVRDYARAQAFSVSAGAIMEPLSGFALGVLWRNLNEPTVSGYDDRVASSLTIGAAWQIRDEGCLVFDIIQEPRFPAEYRMGAEARVLSNLSLQVGARLEPVRPSAGLQLSLRRWTFHYAGDLHPDLGASHEVGLSVRFHQ